MARVINLRGIPDDLFRKFKSACAMNDMDMTSTMIKMMSLYTIDGTWEIFSDYSTKETDNVLMGIEKALDDGVSFSIRRKR